MREIMQETKHVGLLRRTPPTQRHHRHMSVNAWENSEQPLPLASGENRLRSVAKRLAHNISATMRERAIVSNDHLLCPMFR